MWKTIKYAFSTLCLALFAAGLLAISSVSVAYAQENSKLQGIISSQQGPVAGVSIIVKGTTRGTISDGKGAFQLSDLTKGSVLQFSCLGYTSKEVVYDGQPQINLSLEESNNQLDAVIVTAMGIERQSKTLSYSAETVGGKDIADIKSINMINALQGKSAGLQITPNSTGAGGASKILFRGNKSINGSNQPLVVVDGVPLMMNITTEQVNTNWGGQRDGGDAMSTINPDDIASISLLKGASAAALYGAVAANGAIMITTKSANIGRVSVNVSSNTTVDSPISLPEFQSTYGSADKIFSWGDKLKSEAMNYAKDYFRTGYTTNNSVAINGGSEMMRAYFSYGNISSGGITPKNDYSQHTISMKVGFDLFNNKVKVDANAKYVNQHVVNQPAAGFLFNALPGAYLFPRGEDWNGYKTNYEVYDPTRNVNVQNWVSANMEQFSNPYWVANRMQPIVDRNRYEFGGSLKYQIIEGLSLMGRMRYERADENFVHNLAASSGADKYPMGRMKDNRYFSEQLYADALAQYEHKWDNFSLNATVGSSLTRTRSSNLDLWAEGSQFSMVDGKPNGNVMYPNIFNPLNFYNNMAKQGLMRKRLNSVFATATFGIKDGLFIDVTARNDWSSALSFTESCSFFYPSVGASLLLNEFVDMGSNVDLFKFRASYSIVGNDVPAHMTNLRYELKAQGSIAPPEKAPFRTLKPEKTNALEVGFDGQFFQHRLNTSMTYYKSNTKNQFFAITTPWEGGFRQQYVNAGNVQNTGFEVTLGWFEQFNSNFSWKTDLNFSYNKNKIIELVDGMQDGLSLSNFGGAQIILKEGGSFSDLYVRHVKYDSDGKMIVKDIKNDAGQTLYQVPELSGEGLTDIKHVGDMNSKINMGWNNTLRYKNLSLNMLIDFRFGGKVLSMTEATLDGWGVSQRTADARNKGYIERDGVKFTNIQKYYESMGATNHNSQYNNEDYVYDATNIRMREISLGYTFHDLFGRSKGLTLSMIGRNLFFFYKKAPMDPDVSMGTGNGVQGFDVFNLPTTRSFGLNVKINF